MRAFVHLADGLGVATAADGVRDAQTQRILEDAGVGQAQGPYVGAAVPVAGVALPAAPQRASSGI